MNYRKTALIRLLALASVLALALSAVAAGAAGPASWTPLASGSLGAYSWSVKAMGPEASTAPSRPLCLLVDAKLQSGPYSYRRTKYRACADPSTRLTRSTPLIASASQPSDGRPVHITAVGMLLAPGANRVRVTLAGGRTRTIALHKPAPTSGAQGGLGRLRYAAFIVHGTWCVERLVTETATGKLLWDSGPDPYPCTASTR